MQHFPTRILVFALIFTAAPLFAEDKLKWIEFPDPAFELNGLAWYEENAPDLFRFPKRIESQITKGLWGLAQQTSGVRIRFKSDCTSLAIRYDNTKMSGMRNMHRFGQSGVDLYTDGRYVRTAIHEETAAVEQVYFKNAPAKEREHLLYLPLYNGVRVKAIGVNPEAEIMSPQPFALPKPVVFYGTSITQGGCASRGGMSYQAILGRTLNIDFINLGFSGSGKGEKVVAETIAEIDPACFVLDFMANNTPESVLEVYEPFVRTIREKHPETPIVCVTLIYVCREEPVSGGRERTEKMRGVIREVVDKLRREGDRNIVLVEGHSLLGPEHAGGLVDGTHPNDLGFQLMADGLTPTLARILNLHTPETLMH